MVVLKPISYDVNAKIEQLLQKGAYHHEEIETIQA